MGQAIVTVLVLIIVVIYAVLFAFWNQEVVDVVTLQIPGQAFVQSMPLAFLPLVGLVAGAVVMAVSLWGPWASAKRALASVQAELSAVKQQSNERAKKVNRLIEQVKQLKADLAETSGQEAPDDSDLEPT